MDVDDELMEEIDDTLIDLMEQDEEIIDNPIEFMEKALDELDVGIPKDKIEKIYIIMKYIDEITIIKRMNDQYEEIEGELDGGRS